MTEHRQAIGTARGVQVAMGSVREGGECHVISLFVDGRCGIQSHPSYQFLQKALRVALLVEKGRSRAGAEGKKTLCLSYSQVFKARVKWPCMARDLSADGVPRPGEPARS